MLSLLRLLDIVKGGVSTLLRMSWFWQVNIIQSIMLGRLLLLTNHASLKRIQHILKPRLLVLRVPSEEKISFLRRVMAMAALLGMSNRCGWAAHKQIISNLKIFIIFLLLAIPTKVKILVKCKAIRLQGNKHGEIGWWICVCDKLKSAFD